MLFNSLGFIFFFLPITFFVFRELSRRKRTSLALGWLLAASLFFYGWWNPKYLILILSSMAFNYLCAMLLIKFHGAQQFSLKRGTLFFAIAANLLLIGYFKYTFFLITNINSWFKLPLAFEAVVLPIGISFFTFQQIAYLVDIYRQDIGKTNLITYCLVVTFFPHLIAGPLVHYREMIPQFSRKNFLIRNREVAVGLSIFVLGLFKKVAFADSVSSYAQDAFAAASLRQGLDFLDAWGGLLAYSLQIYFDFSGYSDMAIGLGLLFGIKLPINFDSPYKAKNIIEFWRRWHMTLSRFLLNYVYIPLGGNRKGTFRRYMNLMITMLLCGLWHGAGWNYILWGGVHGLFLALNHGWQALQTKCKSPLPEMGHSLAARSLTLLAVILAWVFFRADSLPSAGYFFQSLAGLHGFEMPAAKIEWFRFLIQWNGILILSSVVLFFPNTQEWMARFSPALHVFEEKARHAPSELRKKDLSSKPTFLRAWRPTSGHAVLMGAIAAVSLLFLFIEKNSEFLYFQF